MAPATIACYISGLWTSEDIFCFLQNDSHSIITEIIMALRRAAVFNDSSNLSPQRFRTVNANRYVKSISNWKCLLMEPTASPLWSCDSGTDMCKSQSSQSDKSRVQSIDSSKGCNKLRYIIYCLYYK